MYEKARAALANIFPLDPAGGPDAAAGNNRNLPLMGNPCPFRSGIDLSQKRKTIGAANGIGKHRPMMCRRIAHPPAGRQYSVRECVGAAACEQLDCNIVKPSISAAGHDGSEPQHLSTFRNLDIECDPGPVEGSLKGGLDPVDQRFSVPVHMNVESGFAAFNLFSPDPAGKPIGVPGRNSKVPRPTDPGGSGARRHTGLQRPPAAAANGRRPKIPVFGRRIKREPKLRPVAAALLQRIAEAAGTPRQIERQRPSVRISVIDKEPALHSGGDIDRNGQNRPLRDHSAIEDSASVGDPELIFPARFTGNPEFTERNPGERQTVRANSEIRSCSGRLGATSVADGQHQTLRPQPAAGEVKRIRPLPGFKRRNRRKQSENEQQVHQRKFHVSPFKNRIFKAKHSLNFRRSGRSSRRKSAGKPNQINGNRLLVVLFSSAFMRARSTVSTWPSPSRIFMVRLPLWRKYGASASVL